MKHVTTNTKLSNEFSTKEELITLLAEGRKAVEQGHVRPANEFFDELRRDMGKGKTHHA